MYKFIVSIGNLFVGKPKPKHTNTLSPWVRKAGYTKDKTKAPKPYIPDWDNINVTAKYLGEEE